MGKDRRKEIASEVKMKKAFWYGSDGVSMGHTEVYEFPQEEGKEVQLKD